MSLRPADVSVVVQGPVGPHLAAVLASVRSQMPGAELILSTWRGTTSGELDVDVLVENRDPGSVPYRTPRGLRSPNRMFNTNRMIRSTREGVRRASRPFTLKLRTDTPICGPYFLDWWGRYERRVAELRVFDQRVLCTSVATRPSTMTGYLFHPSDCVQFGSTEDVYRLWNVVEIDEERNASFWLQPQRDRSLSRLRGSYARLYNEQVLWLTCLRKNGHDVDYPYAGYADEGTIEASELSIVNNFLVLEPWQFGVAMPKLQSMIAASGLSTYLWFEDWLALEERWCAGRRAAAA